MHTALLPARARNPKKRNIRLQSIRCQREGDPHIAGVSQWAKIQTPSETLLLKAFPRRNAEQDYKAFGQLNAVLLGAKASARTSGKLARIVWSSAWHHWQPASHVSSAELQRVID